MLQKKERLTTTQFDRFFKSGKRGYSENLQIIYTPHDTFHASVVVGKKVWKSAVKRNKIRRQVYNILYTQKTTQSLSGVYICIVKPAIKHLSFQEIKEDVLTVMKRFEKQLNKR